VCVCACTSEVHVFLCVRVYVCTSEVYVILCVCVYVCSGIYVARITWLYASAISKYVCMYVCMCVRICISRENT